MKAAIVSAVLVLTVGAIEAQARRGPAREYGAGGVPALNVEGSCRDAQKFSTGDDKNTAYKGCMQDETSAKEQLSKRWSTFKARDKQDCVEQARAPSPSYVEVLTCLEMNSGAMTAPRDTGKLAPPPIGGPVAPGLSSPGTPGVTPASPPSPGGT